MTSRSRWGRGFGGPIRAGWLLLAAACESPTGMPELILDPGLTELFLGSHSGLQEPGRRVIDTQVEWAALWNAVHSAQSSPPPRPGINFNTHVVMAVAQGARPTGGYAIHIDSMSTGSAGRMVYVSSYRPGPNCITTQALTQPVHIVAAPSMPGSTDFIEHDREYDCS